MKTNRFSSRHFWTTEAGLTGILVFLLLLLVATYPLARYPFGEFLALVCFSLFLLCGVISVLHSPVWRLVSGGLILVALVFGWIDFFLPGISFELWRIPVVLLAVGSLALALLTQLFQPGAITYHRICGALAVYLLLGWLWSDLYFLVILVQPEAIELPQAITAYTLREVEAQLVYFSFITLTTLGYGDIVPVAPAARLLAMLEALVGQLYPAITLAWLISMEIVSRGQRK